MYCEKVINKKVVIRQIISCLIVVGLFVGIFFLGSALTTRRIGKAMFTDSQDIIIENTWENPYKDLVKDEYAAFIISTCSPLKFDPNVPTSILLKENPNQDPLAVHENPNGSYDCGLFQQNSRNLVYFADLYWPFDKFGIPYDWTNWQHNTYVAIHHIYDLYNSFDGDIEKVAAAYNAGCGAVLAGNIPASTEQYKKEVLNFYKLLSSS